MIHPVREWAWRRCAPMTIVRHYGEDGRERISVTGDGSLFQQVEYAVLKGNGRAFFRPLEYDVMSDSFWCIRRQSRLFLPGLIAWQISAEIAWCDLQALRLARWVLRRFGREWPPLGEEASWRSAWRTARGKA